MALRLKNVITRGRRNLLLVLLCGLMATACSMTRVGYSMAPTLANWELAKFVTLDRQQQRLADERLVQLHEWHRQTELRHYIGWLEAKSNRLNVPAEQPDNSLVSSSMAITPAEIAQARHEIAHRATAFFQQLARPLAEIALLLTPGQVDEIESALARRNAESEGRRSADEPSLAAQERLDRWQSRLEFFIGPLTEKQQAWLAHRLSQRKPSAQWRATRLARQQEFLSILRRAQSESLTLNELTAEVQRYFDTYRAPTAPGLAQAYNERLAHTDRLLVGLMAQGLARQYRHASDLMADYAIDLQAIAGKAK